MSNMCAIHILNNITYVNATTTVSGIAVCTACGQYMLANPTTAYNQIPVSTPGRLQ